MVFPKHLLIVVLVNFFKPSLPLATVRPFATQNNEDPDSVSVEAEDALITLDFSYGEDYKVLVPNRPCSVTENQTIYLSDSQCGAFHMCLVHNGVYQMFKFVCPNDQIFDHVKVRCSPDLNCSTLVNLVRPEFPACPVATKTSFNISMHYSSEKLCGFYTICEREKITMHKLDNDWIVNETIYSPDPDKTCSQAFKDVPIKCSEPSERHIWHRDPNFCEKAWNCRKDRDQEDHWTPYFQWCPPGFHVRSLFSRTFDCELGDCDYSTAGESSKFSCKYSGNFASSKNCDEFYHCHSNKGKFKVDLVTCPAGHYFSKERGSCSVGPCPYLGFPNRTVKTTTIKPVVDCVPIPASWKCEAHLRFYRHPDFCNKYYQCVKHKVFGSCYSFLSDCPPNYVFDEASSSCVPGRCPGSDPVVPAGLGWRCTFNWETHVIPGQGDDCPRYYTCKRCLDSPWWCYEEGNCPRGEMFDDSLGKCVATGVCPQTSKQADVGYPCKNESGLRVNPFDCSKYYECKLDEKGGSYLVSHHSCPAYNHFDAVSGSCVVGNCPQCLPAVPSSLECTGPGHALNYPNDCGKYVKCVQTTDCTQHGEFKRYWSYDLGSCPQGQSFSTDLHKCLYHGCTLLPPALEEGMECEHGQIHAHPLSCLDYIQCFYSIKGHYMGFLLQTCPPKQVFNEVKKMCEPGQCTNLDPELPRGWPCYGPYVLHPHPTNCRWYYKCGDCQTGPGKCMDIIKCRIGFYYHSKNQTCVPGDCTSKPETGLTTTARPLQRLQDGWPCEGPGASQQHPQNCSQFYVCEWCPDSAPGRPEYCLREINSCPAGHIFDPSLRFCKRGSCEVTEQPVTCSARGEKHPFPGDCSKYYSCDEKCKGTSCTAKYVPALVSCPAPLTFSVDHQDCHKHGRCKVDKTPDNFILEGMECKKAGDKSLLPGTEQECNQYYECVKCSGDAKSWCYKQWKCKTGRFFDAKTNKCKRLDACPNELTAEGEENEPDEDDARTERNDNNGMGVTVPSLSSDREKSKDLNKSPMPEPSTSNGGTGGSGKTEGRKESSGHRRAGGVGAYRPLAGTQCQTEGEKTPFPGDCLKYYVCKETDDWSTVLVEKKCSDGKYFNADHRKCVRGACDEMAETQTTPVSIPATRKTTPEEYICKPGVAERLPDPEDCMAYYSCRTDSEGVKPTRKICFSNHYFSLEKLKCTTGTCPHT